MNLGKIWPEMTSQRRDERFWAMFGRISTLLKFQFWSIFCGQKANYKWLSYQASCLCFTWKHPCLPGVEVLNVTECFPVTIWVWIERNSTIIENYTFTPWKSTGVTPSSYGEDLIIPYACLAQFSLTNMHKGGLRQHNFISYGGYSNACG